MNQPETARALLHRHGLPEDVIDGALCLHAHELAAAIRSHPGAIPYRPQLDEDGGFWWDTRDRDAAADLIDPTKPAAVSSAGQAPATDLGTEFVRQADQPDAAGLDAFEASLAAQTGPKAVPKAVTDHTTPSHRAGLRDVVIDALDNAHHTHPCPELGDKTWSGCVHYDEAGRMLGVGVCHSERRADAVLAVLYREWPWLRAEAEDAGAADPAALRDRIAEALMRWAEGNNSPQYASMRRPETVRANAYSRADAVLAVLPQSIEDRVRAVCDQLHRSAVLADGQPHTDRERGVVHAVTRILAALDDEPAAAELRRLADETPATQTPAETCAHCGKTIRRVTGTLAAWWVHDPGGNTVCDPEQAASSPRATPKQPPMDPVRILGIDADDEPAGGARQDETAAAPCVECDHPKAVHGEGDDPVTPGQCSLCPEDDDRHDYRPATKARQDGAQR